jgi:type IV secretory pathway TraG/TraD family ATPase VirD4
LGKIEVLPRGLASLRSRNVTFLIAIQSLTQLDDIYGFSTRRVIENCCSYQAITAVQDYETQQGFSNRFGTMKMWSRSIGETFHPNRGEFGVSRQLSEHRDLLIQPHELSTLDNVVLLTPYGNFLALKSPYYNTDYLTSYQQHERIRRLPYIHERERGFDDLQRNYRQLQG